MKPFSLFFSNWSSVIRNWRWFTLIEMMIVIAIIGVLFSISAVPYSYYMDRARVDQTVDQITQEWSLGHTRVRNGATFSGSTNANIYLQFQSGANSVEIYQTPSSLDSLPLPLTPSSQVFLTSRLIFPTRIQILSISWVTLDPSGRLGYSILAPYAQGSFFAGSVTSSSGVTLTVGYPGGTIDDRRAREILLTPQSW